MSHSFVSHLINFHKNCFLLSNKQLSQVSFCSRLILILRTKFSISDGNGNGIHNHLVRKRTLNHLVNYKLLIHSKTRKWQDSNIQSKFFIVLVVVDKNYVKHFNMKYYKHMKQFPLFNEFGYFSFWLCAI